MWRLLLILVAVSMASCAYLAERERFAARYAEACRRPNADPSPLIEQTVAHPDQEQGSSSEQTHPETPRGTLSKRVIKEVFSANIGEIRYCYEEALRGWPRASGRIVVKFVIDRDGDVEKVAIAADSVGIDPLACCIAEVVRSWRFPEPEGGGQVIVSYPFVLETYWPPYPP